MPRDKSEEWILDDFTPPAPRQIIRIQQNGELSPVWHTVMAEGPEHGPQAWNRTTQVYDIEPGITTWCNQRWYNSEQEVVSYNPATHVDHRECGTCIKKMFNDRNGYSTSKLAKLWFRDGVWHRATKEQAAGNSYDYWAPCQWILVWKHESRKKLYPTVTRREYEVLSVTEFSEREIRDFQDQNVPPQLGCSTPVENLIRYTRNSSLAGQKAWKKAVKQYQKTAEERREADERRQKERATAQARRNLLEPKWVTTSAQQYRHILTGRQPLGSDEQTFRQIACPNSVVVHGCSKDELQLPICPRCALAYKEALIEAELTLPDGTKLPEPMVQRIMAMDPRKQPPSEEGDE